MWLNLYGREALRHKLKNRQKLHCAETIRGNAVVSAETIRGNYMRKCGIFWRIKNPAVSFE